MKCPECPVKLQCPDRECIIERNNATYICEQLESNPAYASIITTKSCTDISPSKEAQPDLPPLWKQAVNLAGAALDYAKSGFENVSQEEYKRRMSICELCDKYVDNRCLICGCQMSIKNWMSITDCPLGKFD